jgi:chemotaxis protein methyltransferase CheR
MGSGGCSCRGTVGGCTTLSQRFPDGNEVEWFLFGRQAERASERGIGEGANRYRTETQCRSLKQEVLRERNLEDRERRIEPSPATMTCAEFLQWALPALGLSWPGFRRVHRQVCRRIGARLQALRLPDCAAYQEYLPAHPDEWMILDSFCRIPISRFVREHAVFERLGSDVLPQLAAAAIARGAVELRCWSAGCASGEEPYSLAILWSLLLASHYSGLALRVIATDIDEQLLERARVGAYRRSSLREVPDQWMAAAFARRGELYVVKPAFRPVVEFRQQDLRETLPRGPFDLILCRYLALTYFDAALQRRTLKRLLTVLRPGGAFVIGLKEHLPGGVEGIEPWIPQLGVYRRMGGPGGSDSEPAP